VLKIILYVIAIVAFVLCGFCLYYIGMQGHSPKELEFNIRKFFGEQIAEEKTKNEITLKEFLYDSKDGLIIKINAKNFDVEIQKAQTNAATCSLVGDSLAAKGYVTIFDYNPNKNILNIELIADNYFATEAHCKAAIRVSSEKIFCELNSNQGSVSLKELTGVFNLNAPRTNLSLTDCNGEIKIHDAGSLFLERLKASVDAACGECEVRANLNDGDFKLEVGSNIFVQKHFGKLFATSHLGDIECELMSANPITNLLSEQSSLFIKIAKSANADIYCLAREGQVINSLSLDSENELTSMIPDSVNMIDSTKPLSKPKPKNKVINTNKNIKGTIGGGGIGDIKAEAKQNVVITELN